MSLKNSDMMASMPKNQQDTSSGVLSLLVSKETKDHNVSQEDLISRDTNLDQVQMCTSSLCLRNVSLPTRARMTVSSGAAGKAMVMFISNICRRSTGEQMEIRSTADPPNNWIPSKQTKIRLPQSQSQSHGNSEGLQISLSHCLSNPGGP